MIWGALWVDLHPNMFPPFLNGLGVEAEVRDIDWVEAVPSLPIIVRSQQGGVQSALGTATPAFTPAPSIWFSLAG